MRDSGALSSRYSFFFFFSFFFFLFFPLRVQELLHYRSASFAARPSGDKSKVSCVTVFRVCVSVSGQFSRGKIIRCFIHRGKEYCYSWNLFRARKTLNFDGKHYAPSVLKRGHELLLQGSMLPTSGNPRSFNFPESF